MFMMISDINKVKPAVDKTILLFLSFFIWICVGSMLLIYAYSWLHGSKVNHPMIFVSLGFFSALFIHHFGFLKIVDKNLGRLLPIQGKMCLFSFMSWKSYLIVLVMITMGILLRHSPVPKTYLSIVYIGIGLSLILSSIRYFRNFLIQLKSDKQEIIHHD